MEITFISIFDDEDRDYFVIIFCIPKIHTNGEVLIAKKKKTWIQKFTLEKLILVMILLDNNLK